ncbi:hypothetical protein OPV22_016701 [Ensete ventricosum]|uniref:Uncharacterized protein n=1 Tax=Ensete ventricosum TaxID=4639 RepID=A0AAV8QRE7_ENSVE|nr:hypothetical protein OPV22_016701 [Ensete ventricosum]
MSFSIRQLLLSTPYVGWKASSMSEVVKEIENIMQVADVNSTAESGSTSPRFARKSGGFPGTGEALEYRSGPFSPRTESK